MEVSVVGAGHVGLVTAASFALVGHRVRVHDVDEGRVARLAAGESPFFEPGLDDLLARARARGALTFHADPAAGMTRADLVFVCVGTPMAPDGRVDLSCVVAAVEAAARHVPDGAVVVNRSTSPVGTAEYVRGAIGERRGDAVGIAVNPEFLSEGSAVADFLFPDRIVLGSWEEAAAGRVLEAYGPIVQGTVPADLPPVIRPPADRPRPVPVVATRPATAELIKYAANAFLAVKISFINEMAQIAEELGGDVTVVAAALGMDRRIGPHFLRAGIGWGGSCFPKDILALQGMAETRGLAARVLRAANEVNAEQQRWVSRHLRRRLGDLAGRRVAVLGLTFKPNTDDLRNSPAVEIAGELARAGVRLRAFDPAVKAPPPHLDGTITLADDPLDAAEKADALLLLTEWPHFADLDLAAVRRVMSGALMIDGRNLFDPAAAVAAGFDYVGVGRRDGPVVTARRPSQDGAARRRRRPPSPG